MAATTFTNDRLIFNAYIEGPDDGVPVVLLHGFPQDASSFDGIGAELRDTGYRTIAFDQRAYSPGARPRGIRAYGIRNVLGDLVACVRSFDLGPVHLVAHDWGGVVGWHAAAHHPDMLRSFTSLSMPHPSAYLKGLRERKQFRAALYTGFFQLPVLPERKLSQSDGERLKRGLVSTGLPTEHADRYVARMREPGALTAALNWYRAGLWGMRHLGVPPSKVPTLYVWGDRDAGLRRGPAEATRRFGGTDYRFEVLKGGNHWLPETEPDRCGALILEHLAAN